MQGWKPDYQDLSPQNEHISFPLYHTPQQVLPHSHSPHGPQADDKEPGPYITTKTKWNLWCEGDPPCFQGPSWRGCCLALFPIPYGPSSSLKLILYTLGHSQSFLQGFCYFRCCTSSLALKPPLPIKAFPLYPTATPTTRILGAPGPCPSLEPTRMETRTFAALPPPPSDRTKN